MLPMPARLSFEQAAALGCASITAWASLVGGRGVDRVVEVGGPGTFQRSIAACATGGHIAAVGFSGGSVWCARHADCQALDPLTGPVLYSM